MKNKYLSLLIVFFALAFYSSAYADVKTEADTFTIVSKIEGCNIDMKQHCQGVAPGGNREILCLAAYEDKLSDACRKGLIESVVAIRLGVSKLDHVYEACGDDRVKLCHGVPAGEGRLIHCMKKHESLLSKACISSLKDTGLWSAVLESNSGN